MDFNISILRVLFTLWILFFHSFNEYLYPDSGFNIHYHENLEFLRGITNVVLYGFAFISGLLMARGYIYKNKYRNKWLFCFDKCGRLLLPYIFWSLILIIFFRVTWYQVFCGAKHLWFLLMLFDIMLAAVFVMPIIVKTGKYTDISILATLSLLPTLIGKYDIIPYVLGVKNAISYTMPFVIGILVIKYRLEDYFKQLPKLPFYCISIVVITCAILSILTPSMPMGSLYMNIPLYTVSLVIYLIFSRLRIGGGIAPVLINLDKNSLGIYILHQFTGKYTLFYYFPSFVTFYDRHCLAAPILLFIFMFVGAWSISHLFHRNKYLSMLIGEIDGRIYSNISSLRETIVKFAKQTTPNNKFMQH